MLNTFPSVTKYIRETPTNAKTQADVQCQQDVEVLLKNRDFDQAFEKMLEHSKNNTNDLIIKSSTFFKEGDSYVPKAIVFKDGKAFKISYENNSFSNDEQKKEELTEKEFVDYCIQKYKETRTTIFENTLSDIQKMYEAKNEKIKEIQRKVAEIQTDRQISQSPNLIFDSKDFSFGNSGMDDILEENDKFDIDM